MAVSAFISTHLISAHEGRYLLGRRGSTRYASGYLSCVAGHVEQAEDPLSALCRETLEEIGVTLDPADLTFAKVLSRHVSGSTYIDFFFKSNRPIQNYSACEPHKFYEVGWYNISNPPYPIVPYVNHVLTSASEYSCFLDDSSLLREHAE